MTSPMGTRSPRFFGVWNALLWSTWSLSLQHPAQYVIDRRVSQYVMRLSLFRRHSRAFLPFANWAMLLVVLSQSADNISRVFPILSRNISRADDRDGAACDQLDVFPLNLRRGASTNTIRIILDSS